MDAKHYSTSLYAVLLDTTPDGIAEPSEPRVIGSNPIGRTLFCSPEPPPSQQVRGRPARTPVLSPKRQRRSVPGESLDKNSIAGCASGEDAIPNAANDAQRT